MKRKVEVEMDIPDEYEPTGETTVNAWGVAQYNGVPKVGGEFTVVLRKLKSPSEQWLETAPAWLPEGCWVYRNHQEWYVSRDQPVECSGNIGFINSNGYYRVELKQLASLHRDGWVAPPCDLIQVIRK